MKEDKLLAHNPLEDADAILSEQFYGRPPTRDGVGPRRAARGTLQSLGGALAGALTGALPDRLAEARTRRALPVKPNHYKVLCISMYNQDIEEMDAKVAELKRRGWTKANRSQLIRLALARLDVDALTTPRQ